MGEAEVGGRRGEGFAPHRPEMGQDRGVTLRAALFGLCISVAVNLLANTVLYVSHGSFMAYSHVPMGNLILCLLSMLGCAALARGFGRRFVFSSTEWVTIFCMGFTSALGPDYGVSGYLISAMVSPYYFAAPENRWAEVLHPHLPAWLVPSNDGDAMTWFYEGLPQGASIPWGVWVVPLFWGLTFAFAVGLACACVAIVFHRQWADHERLVYPAMVPVIEMTTRAGTGERWLPEFMKGKVFWAGFGLTTFVFWWNMIAWFYPVVPSFPTAEGVWLFLPRPYPPLWIFLSTFVICFSYFASLEVLFSLWFSDLLFILEGGALNRLGFRVTTPYWGTGLYMRQTAGGFVALVLWGIWVARRHLRDVLRKALHPDRSPVDDGRELLSCRGALIGLSVSCLYIAAWLWHAGMEVRMIVLLIPATFFVYIGLAKIVADSGFIYASQPGAGWSLPLTWYLPLIALGGANAVGPSTHVALRLSSFAVTHHKGFTMVAMAHVNRLSDFVSKDRRRLFWAICAAFVVGVVVSAFYTIWLGYRIGGYNFQPNWIIILSGLAEYQSTVNGIVNPEPVEMLDHGFFLAGAGAVALLNLLRYRFVWWPLHPVGLVLSGTGLVRRTSSAFFVAWLLKFIMLKAGGASFYRRTQPFFVGMLVGYILAVAAGVVVDAIWFPYDGHRVHKFY